VPRLTSCHGSWGDWDAVERSELSECDSYFLNIFYYTRNRCETFRDVSGILNYAQDMRDNFDFQIDLRQNTTCIKRIRKFCPGRESMEYGWKTQGLLYDSTSNEKNCIGQSSDSALAWLFECFPA